MLAQLCGSQLADTVIQTQGITLCHEDSKGLDFNAENELW